MKLEPTGGGSWDWSQEELTEIYLHFHNFPGPMISTRTRADGGGNLQVRHVPRRGDRPQAAVDGQRQPRHRAPEGQPRRPPHVAAAGRVGAAGAARALVLAAAAEGATQLHAGEVKHLLRRRAHFSRHGDPVHVQK
jgi:hypothetical protein